MAQTTAIHNYAVNVDFFLKIDGIEGESQQKQHEKEIELMSWAWTEENAGSFADNLGGGSGKVSMSDFSFTMPMCKATPKLFMACATGEHIKKATLTCRKAGGTAQEFFKMTLTDVLVSKFTMGAGGGQEKEGVRLGSQHAVVDHVLGGVMPTHEVRFNFTKIELAYAPQKSDGSLDASIPAGYDLKRGDKV